MAAAGVDNSNTEPGTLVLLPVDPDGSAQRLRKAISGRSGVRLAVIITDTMGRPWRAGQTDTAIGAAGLLPLRDHRGEADTFGNVLEVTMAAVADEIAAAADLVKQKTTQIPVAVVRGLPGLVTDAAGPGAAALIRPAADDMFRLGAADVLTARRTVRDFTAAPVSPEAVRRAVAAAITAPAPHHSQPWRFAVAESEQARTALLDDMAAAWRTDLAADGFTAEQVERRVRRGEAAAARAADHRAVPGRRRRAYLPGRPPQRRRAGHVPGRRSARRWRTLLVGARGRGPPDPAGCPAPCSARDAADAGCPFRLAAGLRSPWALSGSAIRLPPRRTAPGSRPRPLHAPAVPAMRAGRNLRASPSPTKRRPGWLLPPRSPAAIPGRWSCRARQARGRRRTSRPRPGRGR